MKNKKNNNAYLQIFTDMMSSVSEKIVKIIMQIVNKLH